MHYIVVAEFDTVTLTTTVNNYINKGYKPQGGVMITTDPVGNVFFQAMIKE